jgi:hypothetical protein
LQVYPHLCALLGGYSNIYLEGCCCRCFNSWLCGFCTNSSRLDGYHFKDHDSFVLCSCQIQYKKSSQWLHLPYMMTTRGCRYLQPRWALQVLAPPWHQIVGVVWVRVLSPSRLLHRPTCWFLHHPTISPWISCINEVSNHECKLVDYMTTREFRELTKLTVQRPRLERLVCWQYLEYQPH